MDFLREIVGKLREIEALCDAGPPPQLAVRSATNDDFMRFAIEVANHCNYLLRFGAFLVSNEYQAEKGLTKHRAIVAGHLVRLGKLYDAFIGHASRREGDICLIFQRLIVETRTRMAYLMKARKDTFRGFVLMAYRPEKEMLEDLSRKASQRHLIPIEKRMLRSVMHHLKEDRVSIHELNANRRWELDGKNFRQLLADIGDGEGYVYGFGMASHWVHGDWFDLKRHHLEKSGGRYKPKFEQHDPDPRVIYPTIIICLSALIRFIEWNRADRDRAILPTIEKLGTFAQALDLQHEQWLQEKLGPS